MNSNTDYKQGSLSIISDEIRDAFPNERIPFRRYLLREEILKLQQSFSLAFRTEIDLKIIEMIMNYCLYVERHIKGRAAGNIDDLIIRYLVRYFASLIEYDSNAEHMEIGALFGATTIMTHHATKLAGKTIPITVIDPFTGYYGEDLDVVTKLKVDSETFNSNLSVFNIPEDAVSIIQGMSNDVDVVSKINNKRLLSLIIDGDHSYEGIKHDWETYSQLVLPGGYVLIDDYNSYAWPDVTDFINREVLSNLNGFWDVVLFYGTTIVLKRTDMRKNNHDNGSEALLSKIKEKDKLIDSQEKELKAYYSVRAKITEFKQVPLWRIYKKQRLYRELQ